MIWHLLLFRAKPSVGRADLEALLAHATHISSLIPTVRSVRAGRRFSVGAAYEALMPAGFPFLALLEFDDVPALEAYLAHPEHDAFAARFRELVDEALILDYEVEAGGRAFRLLDR